MSERKRKRTGGRPPKTISIPDLPSTLRGEFRALAQQGISPAIIDRRLGLRALGVTTRTLYGWARKYRNGGRPIARDGLVVPGRGLLGELLAGREIRIVISLGPRGGLERA